MLDSACQQFAAWRRTLGGQAPVSLAVNLSPVQLRRPGLVDDVRRALQRNALEPERLQLEVTDRSFVMHAQTSDYHRVLIEATIRVAQTLGMDTVAEGIETAGQADLMRCLACDRGQGYFWSRPLEVEALGAWLLRQGLPLVLAA